jgi:hypothetical protein
MMPERIVEHLADFQARFALKTILNISITRRAPAALFCAYGKSGNGAHMPHANAAPGPKIGIPAKFLKLWETWPIRTMRGPAGYRQTFGVSGSLWQKTDYGLPMDRASFR